MKILVFLTILAMVFLPVVSVSAAQGQETRCYYLMNTWQYVTNRMTFTLRCSGYFTYPGQTTGTLQMDHDGSFTLSGCFAWGCGSTYKPDMADRSIFLPMVRSGLMVYETEMPETAVSCSVSAVDVRRTPWEYVVNVILNCVGDDLGDDYPSQALIDTSPDGFSFSGTGNFVIGGCIPEMPCYP